MRRRTSGGQVKHDDTRLVGRSEQRERSGLPQDPWQEGFPWEGSCRDSRKSTQTRTSTLPMSLCLTSLGRVSWHIGCAYSYVHSSVGTEEGGSAAARPCLHSKHVSVVCEPPQPLLPACSSLVEWVCWALAGRGWRLAAG